MDCGEFSGSMDVLHLGVTIVDTRICACLPGSLHTWFQQHQGSGMIFGVLYPLLYQDLETGVSRFSSSMEERSRC